MKTPWLNSFVVKDLDENWDNTSSKPGVYIIKCGKNISRAGGTDSLGILYIGKSLKLRNRLWQFWYCHHPASGFLWKHPKVSTSISGKALHNKTDVENYLGNLTVRVATPVKRKLIDNAERAVLYEYLFRFGELPPLNFSLPKRWKDAPSKSELLWASKGFL